MPFKLSSTLRGHSSDVRAIVAPSPTLILSASRDATAVVWARPDDKAPWRPSATYKASDRFVNAITFIPASPEAPQGYIVTGSQDAIINVYALNSGSGDPVYMLLGHSNNVCSLDRTPNGMIISGSWDQTARVWKLFQPLYELKGHTASVLAVLALNDEEYLTASADKTVKLWHHHKNVRTFTGHTDAVRGLGLLPDIGFASCSNDGDVRVWTPEGDSIFVLSGHTSFVYSVSILPNSDLVSSGEDRTVRVWKAGVCSQTIVHPAISVWTVAAMPNGDIVTGASDYAIRVFSPSEERWASESDLREFEATVASHSVPIQSAGSVDKSKLPSEDALSMPGKKEGENKLISNAAGGVDVYTWAGGSWLKVGEMTDAVGTSAGQKKMHGGKEWDYVFEVDIADGAPKLMLPYNANENPYAAAQRFLAQNDLPPTYLDDVVKFIEQQTAGVSLLANNEYVDPFTGASRYQSAGQRQPADGGYSDPFTGASRYQAPSNPTDTGSFSRSSGDPFTGASRYAPPGTPQIPLPTPSSKSGILPVRATLPFRQCNVPAMRTKLLQLNEQIKNEVSTAILSISKLELQALDRVFAFLQNADSVYDVPHARVSSLQWKDVDIVVQLLLRWPESQRFPLIDLMRLICLFSPSPSSAPPTAQQVMLETLLAGCNWDKLTAANPEPMPKSRETNTLLALRALANSFHIGLDGVVYGAGVWMGEVIKQLSGTPYPNLSKPQRLALATLLFNCSCVVIASNTPLNLSHVELLRKVLQQETTDAETSYRALVGLGNLIMGAKYRDISITSIIEPLPARFPEDRVRSLCTEIKQVM